MVLALAVSAAGRGEEGFELLRQAAARRPHYPPAFLEYGGLLARKGRFDEAVAVLEDGLALTPGSTSRLPVPAPAGTVASVVKAPPLTERWITKPVSKVVMSFQVSRILVRESRVAVRFVGAARMVTLAVFEYAEEPPELVART